MAAPLRFPLQANTQRTEEQGAGGVQVWARDPWGPRRMRPWAAHWHARPRFTMGERGARRFDKSCEFGHLSKPSVIWQRWTDKWDKGEWRTKVDIGQIRQVGQRVHSGGPVIWCGAGGKHVIGGQSSHQRPADSSIRQKNTETYCEFVNKPPISFGIKLNIMELILTSINGRCFDRVKSRPGTYVLVLQHMLVIVIPIIIMRRASLCRPQYFIILVRIQISFVSRGGRQQRSS